MVDYVLTNTAADIDVALQKAVAGVNWELNNNITAIVAPTVNNDGVDTAGSGVTYQVGSTWVDITGVTSYICLDDSTGAAVWQKFNNDGLIINDKFDALVPPSVNDDDVGTAGNGTFQIGSRWIDTVSDNSYVCMNNATGAAVWSRTDNPPAGGAPNNIRDVSTVAVTGNLVITDDVVLGDTSGGNITLTLYAAGTQSGGQVVIKKINAANSITVDTTGAETIDGNPSHLLVGLDSFTYVNDGSNWHIT